jgi:hypothetical protein
VVSAPKISWRREWPGPQPHINATAEKRRVFVLMSELAEIEMPEEITSEAFAR